MRVLVTGANGFVGRHMVRELASHGHGVVALSRDSDIAPEVRDLVEDYLSVDLTKGLPTVPVHDAAIHLAGLAAVGPSFDAPAKYVASNVSMLTSILEPQLRAGRPPSTVVVSSGAVYDPEGPMPLDESSATAPTSPYVVSKLAVEQMALYYARRGLNVTIARPFNHIGPGQGRGFLVPDLVHGVLRHLESGEPLRVGNIGSERDYTDVRDVAVAYRKMIESDLVPGSVLNVCSGVTATGASILALIAMALGVAVPPTQTDPKRVRATDPSKICGDRGRMTQATGWKPTVQLEATIGEIVHGIRSSSDARVPTAEAQFNRGPESREL